MKKNKFGELVFQESDLCSAILQGQEVWKIPDVIVDPSLDLEKTLSFLEDPGSILTWAAPTDESRSVEEFDRENQSRWYMPDEYKNMDIAEYVLSKCSTQEQLQRAGHELLLFQERGLFDLLKYLKYLVDTMKQNQVIWGVGRGSSVSSYVLYLLEVHRVDSMFYDLDPNEFLR